MRTISSPFAAARTSPERCALGSLIPTDFICMLPRSRPAGMRPYTRKTKCDHIFPSAAALAVTCDHISPERRHRRDPRRRGGLAAPQCGAIRAAVGPAGKKPPQAGEGTPRITRARTLGASAVRSRRASVPAFGRLPIAENLKEPSIVRRSIEGGSRDEAALSVVRGVRPPTGGYLTPRVAMNRSAYSAATAGDGFAAPA